MDVRTAYREQSAQGASQIGMVIALYDQAALDLSRALMAFEHNDIELRTREIDHALAVLQQLQGRLDHDRGGEVARNLNRFYDLIRSRLVDAQCQASPAIVREQMDLLLSLRAAWAEVERTVQVAAEPRPSSLTAGQSETTRSGNWSA